MTISICISIFNVFSFERISSFCRCRCQPSHVCMYACVCMYVCVCVCIVTITLECITHRKYMLVLCVENWNRKDCREEKRERRGEEERTRASRRQALSMRITMSRMGQISAWVIAHFFFLVVYETAALIVRDTLNHLAP